MTVKCLSLAAVVGWLLPFGVLHAQGAGAAGAQILQFSAGSRAGAFSGAYTASSSDADVLFYNPAGVAFLRLAGALSFETMVQDVTLSSLSGALRVGPVTVGVSGMFLDAGKITELVPDPSFGGATGIPTGGEATASEAVARVTVALPIHEHLRVGASGGVISSSLADRSSNTPVFDIGVQYDLSSFTVGAALRNAGGALTTSGLRDAEVPTEARLGAAVHLSRPDGLGVSLHSDLIARLQESTAGILLGAEAGYLPGTTRSLGAVARIGLSPAEGAGALGMLKLGAGLTLANIGIDYMYQSFDVLGSVHRFGVRWSAAR
jgi:hypothetical protein